MGTDTPTPIPPEDPVSRGPSAPGPILALVTPAPEPTMEGADTPELVHRARLGDQDAYRMLFERFHDEVYRFAYRRLGDAHVAQDVAADTLADAFTGISRFRWRGAPFEAWLYTIARRRVADRHRARAREAAPTEPVDTPDLAIGVEQRMHLAHHIAALPPAERDVIELRFMEDLDVEQAARRLGKRPGAVRIAQMRGLRRLRDAMASEGS